MAYKTRVEYRSAYPLVAKQVVPMSEDKPMPPDRIYVWWTEDSVGWSGNRIDDSQTVYIRADIAERQTTRLANAVRDIVYIRDCNDMSGLDGALAIVIKKAEELLDALSGEGG